MKVDDLSSILDELYDVSPKWYSIGLQLRLPISDLDAISKENQHPRDCLLEVIHIWLKRSAKPTWKDLVDALESPTVGYPALGRSLRIRRTQISGIFNNNWSYNLANYLMEGGGLALGITSARVPINQQEGMQHNKTAKF